MARNSCLKSPSSPSAVIVRLSTVQILLVVPHLGRCLHRQMPVLEAPRCALHFGETEAAANRGGKPNVTCIESFGFAYPLSRAGYCEVEVAVVVLAADGEMAVAATAWMMTV